MRLNATAAAKTTAPAAAPDPKQKPLATVTGVNKDGSVWATIGGKKQKIATEGGLSSWILGGGRYVAYSGRDGAGGFENEGQSLRVYDTQTGKTKKVMAAYFMIDQMNSVKLSDGRIALLAKMSDGGLGADHFAVIDPTRGIVFQQPSSRRTGLSGDKLTVTKYNFEEDLDNPKALSKKTYDMKELLNRKVIVNKPSPA